MSLKRKIILSLSVIFTMAVALVVGFCLPKPKMQTPSTPAGSNPPTTSTVETPKPTSYTYEAEDVVVKTGPGVINYEFNPNMTEGEEEPEVTAYEYVFGNNMDNTAMAVYLKNIDTTGVNVSFAYLDGKWNEVDALNTKTTYETQTVNTKGDKKYIYVVVTATNKVIPTTFTTNVIWQYGKALTLDFGTNTEVDTNAENYKTPILVQGQTLENEPIAPAPTEEGYYFDAWYLDEAYTQLATFPMDINNQKLYARYANVPQTSSVFSYGNSKYQMIRNDELYWGRENIGTVVVPTYCEIDGVRGPVTSIGDEGLGCSGCTVVLPVTIKGLGRNCFGSSIIDLRSCIELVGFSGDNNNPSIYESYEVLIDFTKLTNLVSLIGFRGASNINILDLSKTKITKFDVRMNIEQAILPSTVTELVNVCYADELVKLDLSRCTQLTSISSDLFADNYNLTEVKLPSSITSIDSNAFQGCTSLESITLPSSLETIGDSAFYECVALEKVDFSMCTKLTHIGAYAFAYCSSLTSVTLPRSVTSLWGHAFEGCGALTSVVLPNGLTMIEELTFSGCSSLSSINFPTSLKIIGMEAFKYTGIDGCLKFPASLEKIGFCAFISCGIDSVDFSECTNLTLIDEASFNGNNISALDLSSCTKLRSIDISAFGGNTITSLVLSSSLECIHSHAFDSARLSSVTIPASVKIIGYSAFGTNKNMVVTFENESTWYATTNRIWLDDEFDTASATKITDISTYITTYHESYYIFRVD